MKQLLCNVFLLAALVITGCGETAAGKATNSSPQAGQGSAINSDAFVAPREVFAREEASLPHANATSDTLGNEYDVAKASTDAELQLAQAPVEPVPVGAPPAARGSSAMVPHCLVSLIEEAQVPAQEAGVLTEIHVREGSPIKAGDVLGKIDDLQPQIARSMAQFEHLAASEKASDDIEVRFSQAAAKVAEYEYRKNVEAAKRVPGSVSEVELQRLKLQWDRSVLGIEKAVKDQKLSAHTASAKKAEVDNADEAIRRRQIRSPIDGLVQKVHPHLGEWVKPGDPAFRVLRMDRLRVEGFLNKDQYNPGEVFNQPVMVEAVLERGRKVQFPGKIVFVDPVVEAGGEYRVWADVLNRQENGEWLLRPGLQATMAIQLK